MILGTCHGLTKAGVRGAGGGGAWEGDFSRARGDLSGIAEAEAPTCGMSTCNKRVIR